MGDVERYADLLGDERPAMLAAYETATRYEWMFWDASWRGEEWPARPVAG